MGPTSQRRSDSDRRGSDTGQQQLLAQGSIPTRHKPAVVRQTIRPRLVGDDRLGQEQPAADGAAGCGRQDSGKISGSLRTADGEEAAGSLNRGRPCMTSNTAKNSLTT